MLEEMLRAEKLEVRGIASGSQAVELLRSGEPVDLVLTDWRLPGADGLAVLDAALSLDPTLPVIVMTAFGSIEAAVDAMKRGAEDFITKPVDPDLLRLLVSRAIERRVRERVSLLFEDNRSRSMPAIIGDSPMIAGIERDRLSSKRSDSRSRTRRSIARETRSLRRSGSTGLVMKSSAPRFIASTAASIDPNAVITITGRVGSRESAASRIARPSAPGRRQSVRTRSTGSPERSSSTA